MNQTQSFQTESLKLLNMSYLYSLEVFQKFFTYKKTSNAYLLRLSSQLSQWNIERISKKNVNGLSLDLSLDDVNALKELIRVAIEKATIKYPDVIYDQLFFLTIGAIQVQSQTGSDKAWALVNQSIQSHLNSQKDKRLFLIGLATTVIVLCMTVMTVANHKVRSADSTSSNSPIELISSDTDPVTISMLQLAYSKMKSGTCQLPQTAMLPPEQRQAFIMFVNKGSIDVNHVENLRLALGYVNCLYPQELMRPQLPK